MRGRRARRVMGRAYMVEVRFGFVGFGTRGFGWEL